MSRAQEAVDRAFAFLKENGYRVLVVNLYGSQNYGLDLLESDFDFKAIVLPTIDEVIRNRKPVSHDIQFEGGLIDVKDIRLMFDNYKKQNTNFIETLFTDFYAVDPEYTFDWAEVRDLALAIAYADPDRAIKCMCGMAKEKEHALCKDYPSKAALIEKYGYDAKQLHHILRLNGILQNYIWCLENDKRMYKSLLTPTDEVRQELLDVKSYKTLFTPAEAKELAANIVAIMDQTREDHAFDQVDENTYEKLEDIKARIMKRTFAADLAL